jgi:RecB family endonuclease NucS
VNRQVYYENGLARIKLERDIGRLSIYDYDDNGKIVAIREYRVKSAPDASAKNSRFLEIAK